MSDRETETDPKEILLQKHRSEKKELQSQIQALKKTAKNDKKKKKEMAETIAKLEDDLELKHKTELEEFMKTAADNDGAAALTNGIEASLTLEDKNTNDEEDEEEEALGPLGIKKETQNKSKAQKRRDKKAMQERERLEEIAKQEELNKFGPRAKEQETIAAKLIEKKLKLKDIASNGDCLFAGVVDQLGQISIESSVEQLRDSTANELLDKPDEYSPFLSNPSTGDMLTSDEYKQYCETMRSTNAWGGQIELRALSVVLKRPIQVIQGEGPDITIGEEFSCDPIILTYHRHLHGLGEHYNSVSPLL